MTRDELLAALRDLPGDPEGDHYEADRLLLAYIGDDEVTAAFNLIVKWYS